MFLIQLPANTPGKAIEGDIDTCVPTSHVRGLDGVLRSWLWPGKALAVASIWVVNQCLEDLCVCMCVYVSLSVSLPF